MILVLKRIALAFGFSALVLSYQNCGKFATTDLASEEPINIFEITNGKIVDDMILETNAMPVEKGNEGLNQKSINQEAASGIQNYSTRIWKNGLIPVKFEFTDTKQDAKRKREQAFLTACTQWSSSTPIRCVPYSNESNFLIVTNSDKSGCYASIGAGLNGGSRILNLGPEGCWFSSVILHEIGHIIGLMHEHQRPDRDQFVTIQAQNIKPGNEGAFRKFASVEYNSEYDFDSVMHYPSDALSKGPGIRVIVPHSQFATKAKNMGKNSKLSPSDIQVVNHLYSPQSLADQEEKERQAQAEAEKRAQDREAEAKRLAEEEEARKAEQAKKEAQDEADRRLAEEKRNSEIAAENERQRIATLKAIEENNKKFNAEFDENLKRQREAMEREQQAEAKKQAEISASQRASHQEAINAKDLLRQQNREAADKAAAAAQAAQDEAFKKQIEEANKRAQAATEASRQQAEITRKQAEEARAKSLLMTQQRPRSNNPAQSPGTTRPLAPIQPVSLPEQVTISPSSSPRLPSGNAENKAPKERVLLD